MSSSRGSVIHSRPRRKSRSARSSCGPSAPGTRVWCGAAAKSLSTAPQANFLPEKDVDAVRWVHQRRGRVERRFRIDHVGQRLVFDLDRFGRILGQGARIRHHRHDPFAGIARHADRPADSAHLRRIEAGHQRHRSPAHSSAPVSTACTPGMASAPLASMPTNTRIGIGAGDQRDVQHAGQRDSATKRPCAGDEAAVLVGAALSWRCSGNGCGRPFHVHRTRSRRAAAGGELDRVDDLLIAGAAAEIAAESPRGFPPRRHRDARPAMRVRDQHAGRAEAALQGVRLDRRRPGSRSIAGSSARAFDGARRGAIGLHREDEAGAHRPRRRTAPCRRRRRRARSRHASPVRLQLVAQEIEQRRARLDVDRALLAIDGE